MKRLVHWLLSSTSAVLFGIAYWLECQANGHRWSPVNEEFAYCRRCDKHVEGHAAHTVFRDFLAGK